MDTKHDLEDRLRAWKKELKSNKAGQAHCAQHAIEQIEKMLRDGEYLGAKKRS